MSASIRSSSRSGASATASSGGNKSASAPAAWAAATYERGAIVTTSFQPPQRTRSIAAQIPIAQPLMARLSAALEHAPALVVRHDLIEQSLLGAAVVEIVAPDGLPEGLAGELASLPEVDRLPQRRRKGL